MTVCSVVRTWETEETNPPASEVDEAEKEDEENHNKNKNNNSAHR